MRADGAAFEDDDWDDPDAKAITFVLMHQGTDSFALLLNAAGNGVDFTLPAAPGGAWTLELSSDTELELGEAAALTLGPSSFALLRSVWG